MGGFLFVLCVCLFQGSLLVIVIMIDGSEKRICDFNSSCNFEKRSNIYTHPNQRLCS